MTPERWQQIECIYHGALESDPDARAAWLAEACAGDAELHREVTSLLVYDDSPVSLIATPALEVAARELAARASAPAPVRIGAYQILSLLGRGGMGEVHLAFDTRLKRQVAIKLLPAELPSQPEHLRRFAQEARAVSLLNHPNILTIYEIGEASAEEGGAHYLITEYVKGETLRQQTASAPDNRLKLGDALEVAAQVATGLAAAHEAGIIHRDIKPENVMVRRDGIVKVLDFGLAKLTRMRNSDFGMRNEDREDAATLMQTPQTNPQSPIPNQSTAPGTIMGTVSYMSPEQARGERVDARTDLFSLGVMLYEMVTGHAPFVGATTSETLAAILRDEPPQVAHFVREVPAELERVVKKALVKDREARYQTASDLLLDLKDLQHELAFEAKPARTREPEMDKREAVTALLPTVRPHETAENEAPHRTSSTNILIGEIKRHQLGVALTLVALVIAAVAAFYYFNRQPILTDKDTILLADFTNTTGDSVFDGTLKHALAVSLGQSPFLDLFADNRVHDTLRLMNRSPDERVTPSVGREICQRQGLKVLLTGTIVSLGRNYVLNLEAVNAQTGEVLAREQTEAEGKEQVVRSLGEVASRMREKLGESLSSIQKFDAPQAEATTSNLEAYKAFNLGEGHAVAGRFRDAIPFLKRAVELDQNFAMAYSLMGTMHFNLNQSQSAAEYSRKAYALRDRAGEYEKLRIAAYYYNHGSYETDKLFEVLAIMKQTFPRDWRTTNLLAGAYTRTGQSDKAIAEARESLRLNPSFAIPYRYLGLALIRLNRFAEGRKVYEEALGHKLDLTDFHSRLYEIAFVGGEMAAAQQELDWASGRADEYVAFDWQTRAAAFVGQWRKAQELSHRTIELSARGDTLEVAAQYATEQALRSAVFGDCRQAKTAAAQGLKLTRGRTSLPRAALALALCGEANQVKPLMEELHNRYPADTATNSIWLPTIHAAMELQRGNAGQAIEQLQLTARYEAAAEFWPQYLRGQAYLQLKRSAEAAAEFQKILDHRGYAPLSPLYPLAQLGLARAAALTGDTTQRHKAYTDFLALWKVADADLPVLIEAKKEYEKLRQ